MAASNSRSTFSYRLLTWGLFPAALLYTSFIALKAKNKKYFSQRLGVYRNTTHSKSLIWCHCASVGEINTAIPLLRSLTERGEHLLISTNTVTGKQALEKAKLENSQHVFFPLDYISCARRLINRFTPKLLLLFETELWPNTLCAIANHSIPIAIINGRISEKTLHAPAWVLKNYKHALQNIDTIIASSEENATRFVALGANANNVSTLDNLKFASISTSTNMSDSTQLNYPFLLCASTHQGEEQSIIEQWEIAKPENLGLVIAIRHPQRTKEVCKILDKRQLPYNLHSKNPKNTSKNKIYIIDTLGQLIPFMKQAEFVFMGGSLTPVGGHNLVEPAQFGRCLFIGPNHDSFKDMVNDLINCKGIIIIDHAQQLFDEVHTLLKNRKAQQQLGNNAKQYLESKVHVLENYQKRVFNLIDSQR